MKKYNVVKLGDVEGNTIKGKELPYKVARMLQITLAEKDCEGKYDLVEVQ